MGQIKKKELLELEKSLEKLCQEHRKKNRELELKQSQERSELYDYFMKCQDEIEDKIKKQKALK